MRLHLVVAALVVVGMIAPAAAAPLAPQSNSAAPDASIVTPTQAATESGSDAESDDGGFDAANYTKLYVEEAYEHLQLKPGESDSFAVTVENGEDHAVDVSPDLVVPQLRQRPVEDGWVSVESDNVTLDAGETREFTVDVAVPEDAELGRYQGSVAFTDETIRYPGRPAQPVHAASFAVQVRKDPTVDVVAGEYLHSQIEAGDSYTHTVVVENTGDRAVPLNPQIGSDGTVATNTNRDGAERSWFEIDAPNEVEPGDTATVEVTISPPEDAALDGYRTELDLGLKDPARPDDNDYWQRVSLSFQVWKQPEEPYETGFSVSEDASSVALELSAAHRPRTSSSDRTSFDVEFVAPNGTAFDADRVRTTTHGSVDLTDGARTDARAGAPSDDSPYSTNGEQRTFRYRVDDPEPGDWTVRITPENTMRFDYEIVRDESE